MLRSLGADGRGEMLDMPEFGISSSAVAGAGQGGAAAALRGPRAGRAVHRGEGGLLVLSATSEALAQRLAELADSKRADGDRRARHARARRLHGLPGDLHGAQRAPGEGDRRRGAPADEAEDGPAPAAPMEGGGRRLDRCSTTSTACCTSSRRRPATATGSRSSGRRAAARARLRRAWRRRPRLRRRRRPGLATGVARADVTKLRPKAPLRLPAHGWLPEGVPRLPARRSGCGHRRP